MNTGKQTFNSGIHGINQEHYRGNAGYKGPAIHDNAEINPAPHKNLLHWRGVSVIGGMFLLILVLAAVSTLIHNKSEQSHSTITKVEAVIFNRTLSDRRQRLFQKTSPRNQNRILKRDNLLILLNTQLTLPVRHQMIKPLLYRLNLCM